MPLARDTMQILHSAIQHSAFARTLLAYHETWRHDPSFTHAS
jgi:hypothetical protein